MMKQDPTGGSLPPHLAVPMDESFPLIVYQHIPFTHPDEMHWHEDLEIGLCLRGRGTFFFSDKVFEAQAGDIFVVSNFEHHVAVSDPSHPSAYLFVFFLSNLITGAAMSHFELEYLSPFWYDQKEFINKISHSAPVAGDIAGMLLEIQREWVGQSTGYRHLIAADLKRLLALLLKHYGTGKTGYTPLDVEKRQRIQPAVDFIRNNFRDRLTLQDVSEKIYLSPSRFRHLFKEVTRLGFKEYLLYLRISEAKKLLLEEPELSIQEVSRKAGFTNLNHFYRFFQRNFKISPARYRKKFSERKTVH